MRLRGSMHPDLGLLNVKYSTQVCGYLGHVLRSVVDVYLLGVLCI